MSEKAAHEVEDMREKIMREAHEYRLKVLNDKVLELFDLNKLEEMDIYGEKYRVYMLVDVAISLLKTANEASIQEGMLPVTNKLTLALANWEAS